MISEKRRGVWARAWVLMRLLSAVASATAIAATGTCADRPAHRKPVHRVSKARGHHKPKRTAHNGRGKGTGAAVLPAPRRPGRPQRWHPGLELAFQMAGRQVPRR